LDDGLNRSSDARFERLARLAVDTPELVVDVPTLHSNIQRVANAAKAAGVALRPHTKTHKSPAVAELQLQAGASGVQVAKLGEAEVMADAGLNNILVGYPIIGETKLRRLASLAVDRDVTISLDSYEVAEAVARYSRRAGANIDVLIELDTGLRRTGVMPGPAAVGLAEQVAAMQGVQLRGVLTHEGHVGVQAHNEHELRSLTELACREAVATAELIRGAGLPASIVSVGSSGSFRFAINVDGVTEVRPGTYVFNDRSQVALGAATTDDVAAVVVATVVSTPRSGEVVIDAGSKALTFDRMIVRTPSPTFGSVPQLAGTVVRLSEEHGVVRIGDRLTPSIGDRVTVIPNHICPVVNLFDRMTLVDGDRVTGTWPVAARGRVQ
jgi:D-serine deaminase-like pyridoxal phosphate-dependent protein